MCLIIHPLTFVSGVKFMETVQDEKLRNIYGALLTLGLTPQFFVNDYDAAIHSWLNVNFVSMDDNADSHVIMPRFIIDKVLYDNGYFCTNINDLQLKANVHLTYLKNLRYVDEKLFMLIDYPDEIPRFIFTNVEKEVINRGCNALLQGIVMGHYAYVTGTHLANIFDKLVKERDNIQRTYNLMLSKVKQSIT